MVKNLPPNVGDVGSIPGMGRVPGEGNGNPSSVPIWEIPWTEKPGGLQLIGSLKVLDTNEVTEHACIITEFLKNKKILL